MAKPHATQRPSSVRSTAAASARTTAGPSASDPTVPTPTSIPRADLSSSGAKAPVASANRSSVGSSSPASATVTPAPAAGDIAKEVAKFLSYDDDSAFPTAVSKLQPVLAPEGLAGLEPLLMLPDPEPEDTASSTVVSASSTVVSACPADAVTASADSTVTQVAASGDSTAEGPLFTGMEHVLAEIHGARGLSPRSKRLLATLVEVADAELNANQTAAATLCMHRAAFWRKVRVGVLAATVFSVAAMDLALAVALFGGNGRYHYHHVLPPT